MNQFAKLNRFTEQVVSSRVNIELADTRKQTHCEVLAVQKRRVTSVDSARNTASVAGLLKNCQLSKIDQNTISTRTVYISMNAWSRLQENGAVKILIGAAIHVLLTDCNEVHVHVSSTAWFYLILKLQNCQQRTRSLHKSDGVAQLHAILTVSYKLLLACRWLYLRYKMQE